MQALILGGTRFIGLHLLQELLRRDYEVTLLNRGQTPTKLPADVERLYADRMDPEGMQKAVASRQFDAVFDFSASTLEALRPGVEALEGKVGRYVFCSTVGVYSAAQTFPITEIHPLAREPRMPIALSTAYGRAKVACEEYLRERNRAAGLPFTILRPCLVYGPHNSQPYWEFSFFARLRRNRPILIPGDGSRILHMVHVDDLATTFASVCDTGESIGQAYTLAGPEAVNLRGYVDLLGRVVDVQPEIRYLPLDQVDEAGLPSSFTGGWIWRQNVVFAIDKAKSHLAYNPRPLSIGLAEAYQWYLAEGLDAQPWDFSTEDDVLNRLKGQQ